MSLIYLFNFSIFFIIFKNYNIESCQYPPNHWCDSYKIAEECKVFDQCHQFYKKAPLVNFTLYYEAECPDCHYFFLNQLVHAYNKIGFIFNLGLVPYGNAEEYKKGNKWIFKCQHGADECWGNIIQTCSLFLYPKMSDSFPFILCMTSSNDSSVHSAPNCAKEAGLNYVNLVNCAKSSKGNALEHMMALKTDALVPPHQFVPWVTLNGEHTDDIENQAENNLIKLICDAYQGEKPDACS